MSVMPVPATELDQRKTLATQARPHEKAWRGDICVGCKTSPHPRGFDHSSQLCWYCASPRVGVESWAN